MNKKIFRGMLFAAITTMSLCLLGCDPKEADGNSYPTVKIGNQVWMAKNLNVNVPGSMCYENKPKNCEKYGRLYTWRAALKACPSGWHLPSYGEFETLLVNVGASKKEQSVNLRANSWGKDKFGFSALPAGKYNGSDKKFLFLGNYASFWSSTEPNPGSAYNLSLIDIIALVSSSGKNYGYSVRCLRD